MIAREIIEGYSRFGLRLSVHNGRLQIDPKPLPPPETAPPELRHLARLFKQHREEVIQLLQSERPDMSNTPDMSKSGVVEATFRPTVELVYPEPGPAIRPVNPEFPRCPECGTARYWITPTGKVVCGSCGQVRLVLTAIEYHALQ